MEQNYPNYNQQEYVQGAVYFSNTVPQYSYQYNPYQYQEFGGLMPPAGATVTNMATNHYHGIPGTGMLVMSPPVDQGEITYSMPAAGVNVVYQSNGNAAEVYQGHESSTPSQQEFDDKPEISHQRLHNAKRSYQQSRHNRGYPGNQQNYRGRGGNSRYNNNGASWEGERSTTDPRGSRSKHPQSHNRQSYNSNRGRNSGYQNRHQESYGERHYNKDNGEDDSNDFNDRYQGRGNYIADRKRNERGFKERPDDRYRGRDSYSQSYRGGSGSTRGSNKPRARGRGHNGRQNYADRYQNLTDEEKERITSDTKTSENVASLNDGHSSLVDKVTGLVECRPSYQRNKLREGDHPQPDRKASKTSQSEMKPDLCAGPKTSVTKKQNNNSAGRVDETQRESYMDQLRQGSYECMVCCCNIRCEVAVWSCTNCYHIFHLYCIKKWARSPAANMEGAEGWRCPGCQNVSLKVPNQYRCFCGKRLEPTYDRFETPHSCGEVCGRQRNVNCPHPCNILCHPGACPPCEATVNKRCECGKTKQFIKCVNSANFHCDTMCDAELNCGKHRCKAVCHSGDCEMCEETFQQECYGNHTERRVTCGTEEALYSSFACGQVCNRLLDCGEHHCQRECHDGPCQTCQLQPSLVSHCPCGKTELSALTEETRISCLDPIPLCQKKCHKPLTCGPTDQPHICEKMCHEGSCGPCQGSSSRRCRCGRLEKDLPCTEASQYTDTNPLLCEKRCTKKRICGRHKCNQPCCMLEEHICDQPCGRKLTCGLHKCERLCHRGNCSPCLQASFDELTCHCGAAVLHPPVACGTRPPECVQSCTRVHTCTHPVTHRCHSDEECPPCTVLTQKRCMGGHELRRNIPCFRQDISCGLPCKQPLPCGQHTCNKTCHKGACVEEGEKCAQLCNMARPDCGHPCGAPCHSGAPCPRTSCKAQIVIKCSCGNRSARVPCSSGGLNDITDFQRMATSNLASSLSSLQTGQSVDISELAAVRKAGQRRLECDKDCALLERNKRVALALEIRNPDLSSKLGNPNYSQFLKDMAKQSPQFVSSVEKNLAELVQSAKQSKQPFRRHAFPPMNMNQRRLIHELAEFYGCETESYDQEPKKNVVATANRDRCWLPSVTLTSLVQRELQPKAPMPFPHKSSESDLRDAVREMRLSTDVYVAPKRTEQKPTRKSPVIDYFDMTD